MTIMLDMDDVRWIRPHMRDPWAILVEPLFGQEVEDLPELLDLIDEDPEDFPDGEPVYVEDLDGEGTPGWVVVYGGVPVPTLFDDVPSYGSWIDLYGPVPDGVTVFVADDGGGGGGFVTTIDDEPVPTGPGSRDTTCSGTSAMPIQLAAAASDLDITTDLSVPTSTDPV